MSASSLEARVDRAVAIASLNGCENAKLAMWRLIDVYIDAVDAIEAGQDIRSTNLSSVFESAGRYITRSAPGDCFDDVTSIQFALEDAPEVLDAARPNRDMIEETEDLLEDGVGRRPRKDRCQTVALAVSEALREECEPLRMSSGGSGQSPVTSGGIPNLTGRGLEGVRQASRAKGCVTFENHTDTAIDAIESLIDLGAEREALDIVVEAVPDIPLRADDLGCLSPQKHSRLLDRLEDLEEALRAQDSGDARTQIDEIRGIFRGM